MRKNERPTLPPGFDVERFARDSDRRLRTADPATESEPPASKIATSETRIATRPHLGAAITNETWARRMTGAPALAIAHDTLKRLPLDHRAGFVLSHMDGSTDVETLVALCGMDRDEVLTIVRDLYDSGVIRFR